MTRPATRALLAAGARVAEHEEVQEQREVEERTAPTGHVVYEAIRAEGESELERPSSALTWSGLAAGLSMGFSFIAMALLKAHTPDANWQVLVTSMGYPIGFIIVVLGRQQLFTENTLTVVLPVLTERKLAPLRNMLRVWSIVLVANVTGAVLVAFVLARTGVMAEEVRNAMRTVAEHPFASSFGLTVLRGIFAGRLIALMVWLLPFAEAARVFVIGLVTYLVGLARFSHIIAGSVDAAFAVFSGSHTWGDFLGVFFIPTLIGNIAGGVLLVAGLNHAQVRAGGDATET